MPPLDLVPLAALLALLATAYVHPRARTELGVGLLAAAATLATGILAWDDVEQVLRQLGTVVLFLVTILVVADVCARAGVFVAAAERVRSAGDGRPVRIRNAREASALGIETVYQDLALADNLDIVQNMFLGRERLRHRVLDENDMERAAAETLKNLRVTTVASIRQPVGSLSGGQRQSVAVAKAVMWNSKLVIMDEPTAALGVAQTTMVLDLIRRLRDQGLAVIVISHNLNDVMAVADRIAIVHLGRMVAEGDAATFDRQRIVELMTTGGRGVGLPDASGLRVGNGRR